MWVAKKPDLQTSINDIVNVINAAKSKILTANDKQEIEDLYKKYGLDISEQNYINSLIRPAE